MTLRPLARTRRAAIASMMGLGLLGLAAGCDPRSLAYFLQPWEPKLPAAGPSLKGKKVVILPHAAGGALTEFPDLEADLARGLARLLGREVRKIELVPYPEVKTWIDTHPDYTDPSEAGLAFDADMVIFLEVEAFQIESPSSPGVFQGESRVHVKAFELTTPTDDKGKPLAGRDKEVVVVHDSYVETIFPRVQGHIPQSETVNRTSFRKRFFDVVLSELSWEFVARGSGDDIQDTRF